MKASQNKQQPIQSAKNIDSNKPEMNKKSETSAIQMKMKQLQSQKDIMMSTVQKLFSELRKKITKSIDKSQKTFQININKSYNTSLSILKKANDVQNLSSLQTYQYKRKVDKAIQSYKNKEIQLNEQFNCLLIKIKKLLEQFKTEKIFEKMYELKQNTHILSFSHIKKSLTAEPINKIISINDKTLLITQNFVQIENGRNKYNLNKQLDLAFPILIKRPIKNTNQHLSDFKGQNICQQKEQKKTKQMLLCLYSNNTLAIYSDKLVLHSHKNLNYDKQSLVGCCQISSYIFIVQKYQITRLNLNNLNEIFIKAFTNQIKCVCNKQYRDMLILYSNNYLQYLSPYDLDTVHIMQIQNIRFMKVIGDSLLTVEANKIKIFKGLQNYELVFKNQSDLIDAVCLTPNNCLLVTKQSHFIHLDLCFDLTTANSTKLWKNLNLNTQNKMIEAVSANKEGIIALSENGKKLYYYQY